MKKTSTTLLALAAISGCVIILLIGLAVHHSGVAVTVDVPDVTKPWKLTHKDLVGSLLSGEAWIEVKGHLDGDAVLKTSMGAITLKSGPIDHLESAHEYWRSINSVEYVPSSVTTGNLTISISIGSPNPKWMGNVSTP